jgi:hypothetical protein
MGQSVMPLLYRPPGLATRSTRVRWFTPSSYHTSDIASNSLVWQHSSQVGGLFEDDRE